MLKKHEQWNMFCIISGILDQIGLLDQRVQHSEDCNPNYVEKELSAATVMRSKKILVHKKTESSKSIATVSNNNSNN